MDIFDFLFIVIFIAIIIWNIKIFIRDITCINDFYDAEERLLRFEHEHPSISKNHPIYEKLLNEMAIARKNYLKYHSDINPNEL